MLANIITLIILILIAIVIIKIIKEFGGVFLKIALHLLAGWITLVLVNFVPGIYIPVNLLTMIISGFGGVFGTILLVIMNIIT
ncbi:MAG: sigmaK-factor processing regulatory BofA [Methanosphaera stadtmanae]|nr:sigmaK-factor processing regulatory BofA [Methanosphaera stadtmanae]